MSWITHHFCIKCDKRVTYNIKMYSMGRCPSCGFKGENACTIMDTKDIAAKWAPAPRKWWEFWKASRGRWLYGDTPTYS